MTEFSGNIEGGFLPFYRLSGDSRVIGPGEVIESDFFSRSVRPFGIYAERFIVKLEGLALSELYSSDFVRGGWMDVSVLRGREFHLRVRKLMPSGGTVHSLVAGSLERMSDEPVVICSPLTGVGGRPLRDSSGGFRYGPVEYRFLSSFRYGGGEITAVVDDGVWRRIFDFAGGIRRYDMSVACGLSSAKAQRLYRLVSCRDESLVLDFGEFRSLLCPEDVYSLPSNVVKKVLAPSSRVLDECSPWSFDWEFVRGGGRLRGTVESVVLNPVYRPELEPAVLRARTGGISSVIGREPYMLLSGGLRFSDDEIMSMLLVLKAGLDAGYDVSGFIRDIYDTVRGSRSGVDYVDSALRRELGTRRGLRFVPSVPHIGAGKY